MSFLKIWGCEDYVKRQVSNKLEPKYDKCLFVGYPKETKGYYFYNPIENKVFVARNGVFLEREFISKGTSGSKVQLEEVREPQDNIELLVDTHSQQTILYTPPIAQNLCRSDRIRHEPKSYGFLVTDNHDVLLVDQNEPTTYQEAMLDPDSEKWLEAMKSKIQSMYDNQVWTLIHPPEGTKTIGCKWIFKKKTDMDGKVHTYKARLVAKGFKQTHGIDYDKFQQMILLLIH